jgi:uncharacterized membrane protein YczE
MLAYVVVMIALVVALALYVAASYGISPRTVLPHGHAKQKFFPH